MRQEEDVKLSWVYFPLHPETPLEGRSLADLFKGRPSEQIAQFQQQMKAMMDAEGLPYGQRSMTWNSRLAQELGAWADTQPGGEAIHDLLYRAYFVDNDNIGDIDILAGIAERAGLDPAAAREVLEQRSFSERVDADWRRAAEIGITGVPSFVSNNLCVVGAQSYEVLMRFVNHLRGLRDEASGA